MTMWRRLAVLEQDSAALDRCHDLRRGLASHEVKASLATYLVILWAKLAPHAMVS